MRFGGKYSLKQLLSEGPQTRKANDKTILSTAPYINYARPCAYEMFIQQNLSNAGMGPAPSPGSSPTYCFGTSTGGDAEIHGKDPKSGKKVVYPVECKTAGGNKATSQGAFSNFVGQPVYDDFVTAWNAWKGSQDHVDLWDKWIEYSQANPNDKHALTGLGSARAATCARECAQYVDAQLNATGVSGLKLPYMICSARTAKQKLGDDFNALAMGSYKQPGGSGTGAFVASAYKGVPYIQIEEGGLFSISGNDPMGFGVPVAQFKTTPTTLSWKRPASAKGRTFSLPSGVGGKFNYFYIAEKGGCEAQNTSTYSLDDPNDCATLASIAQGNGTL